MNPLLSVYLDALQSRLQLGAAARASVVRELATHLEDQSRDLMLRGLSAEEAVAEATRRFGDPQRIAASLSFVHSQGTWGEVALSALPYCVVTLLFASHRWLQLEWLGLALLLALTVSVVGWVRGRPLWIYPWLGYILFPLLLAGTVSMVTLSQASWSVLFRDYSATNPLGWAVGLGLGLVGVGLVCYLLIWISKRDWLHASLLVLPMPALAVSLLAFDRGNYARLEQADVQTALLFFFLAAVVAVVVRLGNRSLKAALLAVSLPAGFLLISGALETDLHVTMAILLSLPALFLVLSPLLLALGASREEQGPASQR